MSAPHAVIVVNPAARRAPNRDALAEARREGERIGWRIDIATTTAPGEATALARQAGESGASCVFACGGDGTLNEVLNGIVKAAVRPALGFIPAGTVNIWAREHSLPSRPAEAIRLLATGATRIADAGHAEWLGSERAFLLMAGLGFDAVVARAVGGREKRLAGTLAYARAAVAAARPYRSPNVVLRFDHETYEGKLALLIASNARLYGGFARPAPEALVDDGLLDITLLDLDRLLPGGLTLLPRLLRDPRGHRRVRSFRAASVSIETDTPSPLQLDGEVAGETPVRLTTLAGAVRVIVPPGPNPLYRGDAGPSLTELLRA